MSISILLLVILTLVALGITLVFFNLSEKETNKKLIVTSSMDSIYTQAAILNFYLENAFLSSTKDLKYEDGKEIFVKKFREELTKYENVENNLSPYIRSLIIDLENKEIDFNSGKVSINLYIHLNSPENIKLQHPEINYDYTKKFEKYF